MTSLFQKVPPACLVSCSRSLSSWQRHLTALIFFSKHVLPWWQSLDGCLGFKCLFLVQLAGAGLGDHWESFGWLPILQRSGSGHSWKSVVEIGLVPRIDLELCFFCKQNYM